MECRCSHQREERSGWLLHLRRDQRSNSYSTACLPKSRDQRSRDPHDIMVTSVLEFILKISGWSDLYTTAVFHGRLGWIQSVMTAFDEFIWAFRNRRHKDCLSVVWDVLFWRFLPGAMGYHHQRWEIILRGWLPSKSMGPWHRKIGGLDIHPFHQECLGPANISWPHRLN